MKTIAFEKLRAEFWDASFVLTPYHSHCTQYHYAFQFDYNELTVRRAVETLNSARKFIDKLRPEYPAGDGKRSLDRLSKLIIDSHVRIATEMSDGRTTYRPPTLSGAEVPSLPKLRRPGPKLTDGGRDDCFF